MSDRVAARQSGTARPRTRAVAALAAPTGDLSLLSRLANDEGMEVTVLYAHEDRSGRGGAGEQRFRGHVLRGIPLRRNAETGVEQVWNRGVGRALARLHPQVLLVGGYGQLLGLQAIAWATRHGIPWVLYSESRGVDRGPRWRRRLKSALLPPLLRRAAGFVTYGEEGERYLRAFGGTAPVVVLGSNRDLASIAERSDAARAERTAPRAGRAFLFVGRLVQAKGVDVLLEAFGMAARDLPGWRLDVAGDGSLRGAVERAAASLPVRALGSVPFPELAGLLAGADVLVLPSRHEPWGQVVPEAMAARLPVISSDAVGAARTFVRPGATGWSVPAGDAVALARAMRDAAGSDLDRMGGDARDRALRYDVREEAPRVAELLRSVAGRDT